jgi:hypothetical protein
MNSDSDVSTPNARRATESPFHFFSQRGKLKTTDSVLFEYAAKGNAEGLRQLFTQEDYLRNVDVDIGDEKVTRLLSQNKTRKKFS